MLTAAEFIELFDSVTGRASSDYERATIARLTEIVGSDPEKWVAMLAAHGLACAAMTRDADQALRDRQASAEEALARSVDQVRIASDAHTRDAATVLDVISKEVRAALGVLSEFSSAAQAAAQAATRDISEARSEAVGEAARSALASLGRVLPERLATEAASIAAIEAARLRTTGQIVSAIWATIGFGLGLAVPIIWKLVR